MRFTRGFGDGTITLDRQEGTAGPELAAPPVEPSFGNLHRLRRSAPNPRDVSLSAMAAGWCERFPLELRPVSLCRRYPRIANRLALCWDDRMLTHKVFEDLLVDRRGNRRGFPSEVQRELLMLRDGAAP